MTRLFFFRWLIGAAFLMLFVAVTQAQITSDGGTFSGVQVTEKQLAGFLRAVKTLEVGASKPDQIIDTLGRPHVRNKEGGRELWKYSFLLGVSEDLQNMSRIYQVDAVLELDSSGTMTAAKVERLRSGETEVLYRRGNEQNLSPPGELVTVAAKAPVNPRLGTIFFNTSDRHFYGWNGTEWRRFDK